MNQETIGLAQAKKIYSDFLGKMAYGKMRTIITKKGKPGALLSPPEPLDPVPFQEYIRRQWDESFST